MKLVYSTRRQHSHGVAANLHEVLEHADGDIVPHVLARCSSAADARYVAIALNRLSPDDRAAVLRETVGTPPAPGSE